jgi:hypothetical protein
MATEDAPTGTTSKALPGFESTPHQSKSPIFHTRSTPNPNRRHSLPLHFLPPTLWNSNASAASLVVESEEAAQGEHILDEATIAHRIGALRQLNGATRSGHRYAKSTGARNTTFSQPVIVRTYSGATRPTSQQRDLVTVKKENGHSKMNSAKMDLKLPPVEAFSFKGIMDEIRNGVSDDLERIAEICARSKYSLSNQYEVHMPPHGRGESFLPGGLPSGSSTNNGGPTLQAVGSDDEHGRQIGRGSRGGRRTKSVAYGTLETIMSSSRSSDEDNTKKRPAAVLAEEVRGRATMKAMATESNVNAEGLTEAGSSIQKPKHVRSKSATFASVIIDNAQGLRHDTASQMLPPTSLISEPARPQTSTPADLVSVPAFGDPPAMPTLHSLMSLKPAMIQNESRAVTSTPESGTKPSILGSLSSWLPWNKPQQASFPRKRRSASHAEGSLRDLLKATDVDAKGKGVDRLG